MFKDTLVQTTKCLMWIQSTQKSLSSWENLNWITGYWTTSIFSLKHLSKKHGISILSTWLIKIKNLKFWYLIIPIFRVLMTKTSHAKSFFRTNYTPKCSKSISGNFLKPIKYSKIFCKLLINNWKIELKINLTWSNNRQLRFSK